MYFEGGKKMLVVSKCNIISNSNNYLTIYNTLHCNISRFAGPAKECVESIINSCNYKEINEFDPMVSFLKAKGYLISAQENENETILHKKEEVEENSGQLFLTIYVTEDCNFRCKYCPEVSRPNSITVQTQKHIIKFLNDVLPQYKTLVIAWFGGEPLLELETIISLSSKIKEICSKYKVIYSATITTNGYNLDSVKIEKLVRCNIFTYCISIDGIQEVHDFQRPLRSGDGTWQTIINNMIDIKDNVKSFLFRIIMRTNVTTAFLSSSQDYLRILEETFSNDKRFWFMWKKAEDWGNIEDENLKLLCSRSDFINFLKALNKSNIKNNVPLLPQSFRDSVCEGFIRNALVIFPEGRVSKCSRDVSPEITTLGMTSDLVCHPERFLSYKLSMRGRDTCVKCGNYYHCFGLGCPMENTECYLKGDYLRELIGAIPCECIY